MVRPTDNSIDLNVAANDTVFWFAGNNDLPKGIDTLLFDSSAFLRGNYDELLRMVKDERKLGYITKTTMEWLLVRGNWHHDNGSADAYETAINYVNAMTEHERVIDVEREIDNSHLLFFEDRRVLQPLSGTVTSSLLEQEVKERFERYYELLSALHNQVRERNADRKQAGMEYFKLIHKICYYNDPLTFDDKRYMSKWKLLRQEIDSSYLKLLGRKRETILHIPLDTPCKFTDVRCVNYIRSQEYVFNTLCQMFYEIGHLINKGRTKEDIYERCFREPHLFLSKDRRDVLAAYAILPFKTGSRTAIVSNVLAKMDLLDMRKSVTVDYSWCEGARTDEVRVSGLIMPEG